MRCLDNSFVQVLEKLVTQDLVHYLLKQYLAVTQATTLYNTISGLQSVHINVAWNN